MMEGALLLPTSLEGGKGEMEEQLAFCCPLQVHVHTLNRVYNCHILVHLIRASLGQEGMSLLNGPEPEWAIPTKSVGNELKCLKMH